MIKCSHQPESSDHFSPNVPELSWSIRLIILEDSPEILSISEVDGALTLFDVILEVAFIFDPLISQKLEMRVIKLLFQRFNVIVVEHSIAVKFILFPFAFVC